MYILWNNQVKSICGLFKSIKRKRSNERNGCFKTSNFAVISHRTKYWEVASNHCAILINVGDSISVCPFLFHLTYPRMESKWAAISLSSELCVIRSTDRFHKDARHIDASLEGSQFPSLKWRLLQARMPNILHRSPKKYHMQKALRLFLPIQNYR